MRCVFADPGPELAASLDPRLMRDGYNLIQVMIHSDACRYYSANVIS